MSDEPTEMEYELGEDASFYVPKSEPEKRRMWSLCLACTLTKDPQKIITVTERINTYLRQGIMQETGKLLTLKKK